MRTAGLLAGLPAGAVLGHHHLFPWHRSGGLAGHEAPLGLSGLVGGRWLLS